jgi:hypothetical protein
MLLSLAYLVVRTLLRLLVPHGRDEAAKDLEIVVLRHQLCMCFGDRASGLGFDRATVRFCPPLRAVFHGLAGRGSSSRRGPW